ncbi:uncharacterized protein P884DRAFT_272831 [Thermothelomyces heterothallicus CBS 202.75]|uniref:uncharacterized protein n=1 Tax=Thermothelomyces heterothallicus CBS 202.75 TaxID=1149848 RepID=UPI0037437515
MAVLSASDIAPLLLSFGHRGFCREQSEGPGKNAAVTRVTSVWLTKSQSNLTNAKRCQQPNPALDCILMLNVPQSAGTLRPSNYNYERGCGAVSEEPWKLKEWAERNWGFPNSPKQGRGGLKKRKTTGKGRTGSGVGVNTIRAGGRLGGHGDGSEDDEVLPWEDMVEYDMWPKSLPDWSD